MTTQIAPRPIPRKLDQGMINALSEAIAKGNYAVTACQLCGIHKTTFYDWIAQGEKDIQEGVNSKYTTLIYSLQKAESDAEAKLVEVVREAAEVKREWLPAITFLERRHPDRWGRKDRTTVDIRREERIQITHVTVTRPAIDEVVDGEYKDLPGRLVKGLPEGQELEEQEEH